MPKLISIGSNLAAMQRKTADYYSDDHSRLRGKPKQTIATEVQNEGILVPRIFGSFQEAKEAGVKVIARSEHEQDYDGASGLFYSPRLYPGHMRKGTISAGFEEFQDEADFRG